jgi:secreted PhoX family phosphatase
VSEATGATFGPNGKWLFINLQYPGETLAITDPWEKGVL